MRECTTSKPPACFGAFSSHGFASLFHRRDGLLARPSAVLDLVGVQIKSGLDVLKPHHAAATTGVEIKRVGPSLHATWAAMPSPAVLLM